MNNIRTNTGMTLIEIIIFIVLLTMLLTNTINLFYSINISNVNLLNEIDKKQNGQD